MEKLSELGVSYIAGVDEDSSNLIGLATRKDLSRFLDSLDQVYKTSKEYDEIREMFLRQLHVQERPSVRCPRPRRGFPLWSASDSATAANRCEFLLSSANH